MNDEIQIIQAYSEASQDEFWKLLKSLKEADDYEGWSTAIYYRCATDLESFAGIFFPQFCTSPFNTFHYDTFKNCIFGERGYRQANAAPRGNAKSTIKVLIKPIHDICYKLEKFTVIVSNTSDQAESKVKDIRAELIDNNLLIDIYGRFIRGRKGATTDFIAHNGDWSCRILALGAGTEMRGIRYREVRPTKIILDDVEHSEEVENESLREKLKSWYQDVISNIGDEHTNIDFVGTVLHRESLLVHLLGNPRYKSKMYKSIVSWASNTGLWDQWKDIYIDLDNDHRLQDARNFFLANEPAMLEGSDVLWPEKESYYFLQEKIIESGIRSFMKEKQNDPMSDQEKVFDRDTIWWYDETPNGLLIEKTNTLIPWNQLTAYGAIDPSTGQTKAKSNKKPDFTAIISGYVDGKKRLFVDSDFLRRVSPSAFISQIFQLNEQYKYYKFGVETNLFRNLLIKSILDEKERIKKEEKKEVSIKFYDIELHENKEKRIYSIEPKVFHGWILFNKKKVSQEFMNQLYDFPKAQHDDGPDCLEMLFGLVNNKYTVGALDKETGR